MEALFTSIHGGDAIRRKLMDLVEEASALAALHRVDVHVMAFSFTDEAIAEALLRAAELRPRLTVRLLADWGQRTLERGQQTGRLADAGLANLMIRYTLDQPYVWDAEAGHMRWSYHASRGLLHHKTLGVLVEGKPWKLACGSFNWTAKAVKSYENLLVLSAGDPESRMIASRIEFEFEALWSEGNVSLSVGEARAHYQAILESYRRDPTMAPSRVAGIGGGLGEPIEELDGDPLEVANAEIAFSSRPRGDSRREAGFASKNRERRMVLCSAGGRRRLVPVSITNLALDAIFQTKEGELLEVALYGFSPRVAEYGALLEAARRGAKLRLLLDRDSGRDTAARLAALREQGLPIEIRTVGRMMHEKYLVWPDKGMVVTGTANFSTDASARHWEHRLRISGNQLLAAQYSADFREIWSRLTEEGKGKVSLPLTSSERSAKGSSERSLTEEGCWCQG